MEMSSGRAAKKDDGFTLRTVMAMATEMAEARAAMDRACVLFAAHAAAVGVKVMWDNLPNA